MNSFIFKISISLVAIIFLLIFCIIVVPAVLETGDVLGAFAAGFVNPFASGYSADVICCWVILALWVFYESTNIKYGWVCVLLGAVPGVAVGFAAYLLLRMHQLKGKANTIN